MYTINHLAKLDHSHQLIKAGSIKLIWLPYYVAQGSRRAIKHLFELLLYIPASFQIYFV